MSAQITIDMFDTEKMGYRGARWQVVGKPVAFRLRYEYGFKEDWHHPDGWYSVMLLKDAWGDEDWHVVAWRGCAWDGATKYPDFKWMIGPSLLHDILHWLIKRGIIAEHYNDVIDLELKEAIIHGKEPIPWYQGGNSMAVRKLRAHLVLRGTNLADEKKVIGATDMKHKEVLL